METKIRLTKDEIARRKEHAKLLYTRDGIISQKELSQRSGISENTIGKWINEECWSKLRVNIVATREEQMINLLDELSELNAAIKSRDKGARYATSKEADTRRKLVKDIKDLETKAALPEILTALKGLIDFTRKENFEDAKTITYWGDVYVKSLLK